MWRRALQPSRLGLGWRRASSLPSYPASVPHQLLDEGDWSYYSEWWREPGPDSGGRTVFREHSDSGNGVVTVVAYPSSRPDSDCWPATERWLQDRYAKLHPEHNHSNGQFKILGYEWRVLHFNDTTRQSTVKTMSACRTCGSDSGSLFLVQQPNCLPVPYVKSMLSAGLTTLASLRYDLLNAASGKKALRVLCVGHGGGSIPLFIANKIKGAIVHSVDIDPLVISASVQAMGFPASAAKETPVSVQPIGFPALATKGNTGISKIDITDQLVWEGIQDRLFLYQSDAQDFVLKTQNIYDLVFIDAYDGDDIFHHKLWDPDGPFLKALADRVHPEHGTVVVNLHTDTDTSTTKQTEFQPILPMGRYVEQVARAYKEHMGMAFTISAPWLCNTSLVSWKGSTSSSTLSGDRSLILNSLLRSSDFVEHVLDLPFPCFEYVNRDFRLVK